MHFSLSIYVVYLSIDLEQRKEKKKFFLTILFFVVLLLTVIVVVWEGDIVFFRKI